MFFRLFSLFFLVFLSFSLEAKSPELTSLDVISKIQEIMKVHVNYKKLDEEVIKRILNNFLDELDPIKTYFIETDIETWLEPSQSTLKAVLKEYQTGQFTTFEKIFNVMVMAIERRRTLEKKIHLSELPSKVDQSEFKDLKWVKDENALLKRLIDIQALQMESASKLSFALKEKSLQRILKRQKKYEEELLTTNPQAKWNLIYTKILKATASSLDSHTAYFTPDEATQFMINVQQRLFGIGAQLRDDINGFTVVKIIEGGPAFNGKELKAKDRIIAVNGEPVVGMDIEEVVEMIRGKENTSVTLTVVREVLEGGQKKEHTLDTVVSRGEVVLKETRLEHSIEPYGDGVIAYLKLYSFYQDPESSSAADLLSRLEEIQKEHKLLGVILDLRSNSGGMLSQAVDVTGLFIGKGVVVSIKDENGAVQHLRHLDSKTAWDGNLFILISQASASASEIVAGTLKDYGRALIIGDEHSYGKGSFQTFTLNSAKEEGVNSKGEYKVTRGIYYTVSGNTPQLTGVLADIVVPGPLKELEIGEKFTKYPLKNDTIPPSFDDNLDDVPWDQKEKIRLLYKFNLQPKLETYQPYLEKIKENSKLRIEQNKNYQLFLKELKTTDKDELEEEGVDKNFFGDLQLQETLNVMRDLIFFQQMKKLKGIAPPSFPSGVHLRKPA